MGEDLVQYWLTYKPSWWSISAQSRAFTGWWAVRWARAVGCTDSGPERASLPGGNSWQLACGYSLMCYESWRKGGWPIRRLQAGSGPPLRHKVRGLSGQGCTVTDGRSLWRVRGACSEWEGRPGRATTERTGASADWESTETTQSEASC